MYANELGPAVVCRVKMLQMLAVRICPPRADEYGFDRGHVMQIVCEGSLHGLCIFEQREGVCFGARHDKLLDFCERMLCLDVDALDGLGGYVLGAGDGLAVEGT